MTSETIFRSANWIFVADSSVDVVNTYFDYQTQFRVDNTAGLTLHLCAHTPYAAYVNGKFVDCGQYAGYENYQVYDSLDISGFVTPGENTRYQDGPMELTNDVLAMGAFYVTPELGKQCADAYLYNNFGSSWEWWPDFDRFHQMAIDELNAFDYEAYKANGFKLNHLDDCACQLYDRPEGLSPIPMPRQR